MIPLPAASMISSARSAAWGFSILAISGMSASRSFRRASIFSRSEGLRTKDTASRSMPFSQAKSIQGSSEAPVSGRSWSAPGRLTPWWELTAPPASTSQVTAPPSTETTRRRTRPSARNTGSPSCTALAKPSHWTVSSSALPGVPLVLPRSTTLEPECRTATSPSRSPSRSLGPGRSPRIPTSRPTSSLTWRIRLTFSACSSGVPCAKLSRKTSTPASNSSRRTSSELLAGPTVATILVRRAICRDEGISSAPTGECEGRRWARPASSPSRLRSAPRLEAAGGPRAAR